MNNLNKMNATELVEAMINAWVQHDSITFMSLFARDAQITHPFFEEPVAPSVVIDVINATVKPTTTLQKLELISGTGEGINDMIRLTLHETGNEHGRYPEHLNEIVVTAEIKNHRYTNLFIHCFNAKTNSSVTSRSSYNRRKMETVTSREIARMLAQCWSDNDMDTFVSLFSSDAKILHPALEGKTTPEVVADLMNSDVSVTTELKTFSLLRGNGSGENDVVEIQFNETGNEVEYQQKLTITLLVTASIKEHQIIHLNVHGYQPVDNKLV